MADLYDLGERPPLGEVPKRMHAYLVRQSRFGQPRDAWKREVIPTPTLGEVYPLNSFISRGRRGSSSPGW